MWHAASSVISILPKLKPKCEGDILRGEDEPETRLGHHNGEALGVECRTSSRSLEIAVDASAGCINIDTTMQCLRSQVS